MRPGHTPTEHLLIFVQEDQYALLDPEVVGLSEWVLLGDGAMKGAKSAVVGA
jgi:hypothetical protein